MVYDYVYGDAFGNDNNATVYYLLGTTGWDVTFAGRPTVLWNLLIQASGPGFGVRTSPFGVNVTGRPNIPIVVEASRNLASASWTAPQTRPGFDQAHISLGLALAAQGKWDEAIQHCRLALKSDPNLPNTHINLGLALAKKGQWAEAIAHYQQALAIQPKALSVRNNLAWLVATCPQAEFCARLRLYQARSPYREPAPTGGAAPRP
jgi:tetratricopeptide (TPR) repeat protein